MTGIPFFFLKKKHQSDIQASQEFNSFPWTWICSSGPFSWMHGSPQFRCPSIFLHLSSAFSLGTPGLLVKVTWAWNLQHHLIGLKAPLTVQSKRRAEILLPVQTQGGAQVLPLLSFCIGTAINPLSWEGRMSSSDHYEGLLWRTN